MAQKITEQVAIEFRAGFGDGSDGKKGERFLLQFVDPRHAHTWRGLQGEGVPAWMGHVYIYQGDDLVSVLAPADGDRLPERASAADAIQLRAEVSRLEGHRTTLQQQLELVTTQLRLQQEQLAGVQTQLVHERERYVREVAELDASLSRARQECLAQREQLVGDLQALREQAKSMREEAAQGVKEARAVLGEVHDHVRTLRDTEFEEARHIAARRVQLERQCTKDLALYQALAANPGQPQPGFMESFIQGLVAQGTLSPDFILAVIKAYKGETGG